MARILVADDDPDIRDLLVMVLEVAGHEVTSAADGSEAWAELRRRPFDVTILDRMMPGLDGLSVLARCRADPDLHRNRIILLTAKAQDSEVEEGYAAGADLYVTKPFSPRELMRIVAGMAPSVAC